MSSAAAEFNNIITRHLEGSERYCEGEGTDLETYRYSSRYGDICVMYFSAKLGAITSPGMREMNSVLEQVADDPDIVGVVLTENNAPQTGKPHLSFPGINIKEFGKIIAQIQKGNDQLMIDLLKLGQGLVQRIAEYPKRIVSTFLGDCYGGGVELTCFTHSVLGENAAVALPECTLDPLEFLDPPKFGIDTNKIKNPSACFLGGTACALSSQGCTNEGSHWRRRS